MKKILITGITGTIGRETVLPLQNLGFEIYAIVRSKNAHINGVHLIEGDLLDLDFLKSVCNQIKPTHLLHTAWPIFRNQLNDPIHFQYLAASYVLINNFLENSDNSGRIIVAGTCSEYEESDNPIKETHPLTPLSLYAQSKCFLHDILYNKNKISTIDFAWARIFYVLGYGESSSRLTPYLITSLHQGKPVTVNNGAVIRDYSFSKDIGLALAMLADSNNIQGPINVCRGEGIRLADYALQVAEKLNKKELLHIRYEDPKEALYCIGDNTRLKNELGFIPQYSIAESLDLIIPSYISTSN